MPSSLIVVALVVAWLVVLVPMVVRKRQEIARTADSALAARVVRSGGDTAEPEGGERAPQSAGDPGDRSDDGSFPGFGDFPEYPDDDFVDDDALSDDDRFVDEEDEDMGPADRSRRYRPGRGGFDPEAAARAARAKYAFRQRIVVLMILTAIGVAVVASTVTPWMWWAHGVVDATLVTYLTYLRRQVRIEEEVRQRRLARMTAARRSHARPPAEDEYEDDEVPAHSAPRRPTPRPAHPRAAVVDVDDEDPWFDDLGDPSDAAYRRAAGQ